MADQPSISSTSTLLIDKHRQYVKSLEEEKLESFEYWMTEHLRVSGLYWALTGMEVLHALGDMSNDKVLAFVISCQLPSGGFGGNVNHDPHLLYTLSALQILAQYGALDKVNTEKAAEWVASLQQPDGSFSGDKWGEIDTRFSYCAISALSLLKSLNKINCDKAVEFLLRCQNFDGAFGVIPDAESHAGALDFLDRDLLGWWLAERQVKEGGLNGRPEKLADVCYSWWVLSCLSILERLDWIDQEKLKTWILSCQDDETGGIADKPGNMVDVYHTCFGITGLSLLGYPGLAPVNPSYCMTKSTIDKLNLPPPPPLTIKPKITT